MSTVPPIAAWPAAPLHGKVVLVTGGANGIGRGIAQAVLGAGGRVLIGDLDEEAGHACLHEWQRGQDAAFQRVDIADEASVGAFIADALQRFGRIDGLVNNAGIAGPHGTLLQEMDWEEWQRRLSSLHGAFLCSKHALPALSAGSGAIINIASTRAWQSEAHSEAYAAAKGGLLAFTHALAISAGPAVRVNSISPGWISTDAWQAPPRRHAPQYSAEDHAQHPVGRVGQPEDIGALAVYLLSSLSGFTTGQDFIVDGGMTRKMIYAD
ncbi:MAG: SDR family oxidoreductase [Stenotrophomonas sp.]